MSTTEEQPSEPEQSAESQPPVDPELVRQLAQRAADEGVDLAGPGGLLQQLTKQVLETGLEVEMSEHLGDLTSTRRLAAMGRTPVTALVRRR